MDSAQQKPSQAPDTRARMENNAVEVEDKSGEDWESAGYPRTSAVAISAHTDHSRRADEGT